MNPTAIASAETFEVANPVRIWPGLRVRSSTSLTRSSSRRSGHRQKAQQAMWHYACEILGSVDPGSWVPPQCCVSVLGRAFCHDPHLPIYFGKAMGISGILHAKALWQAWWCCMAGSDFSKMLILMDKNKRRSGMIMPNNISRSHRDVILQHGVCKAGCGAPALCCVSGR